MKKKAKKVALSKQFEELPNIRQVHKWTPEIDALIIKHYHTKGSKAIGALLGIPPNTIASHYRQIDPRGR